MHIGKGGCSFELFGNQTNTKFWGKSGDNGSSSVWKEIALDVPGFYFSYSTLASLVESIFSGSVQENDANNAPIGLCYIIASGQNIPVAATLLYLTMQNNENKMQFAFRFKDGEIYNRFYTNDAWSSWYKVATTLVQA